MDVRLSPEQRALRASATQVVDRLGPRAVGQLDDTERVAKLDAAVQAAGWRELRAADDAGAPWASGVEVGILAEELGRGLADTAFLGPTLAAELRRLAGAPPAPAPETVALTRDLSALADGADAVALDAAGATAALVLVPPTGSATGHTLAQVAVPGPTPGGSDGSGEDDEGERGIDLTRTVVGLDPEATVVPLAGQVRPLTADDVDRWIALALATTSADLVGTMQGAVALATDYARDRRQYGRPIGSFQAVQHLLADAFTAGEGARSVALHATWAVDALSPGDALAAAATAKAYCTRAARQVCETAIQVHGGIGNTWECLAHVHLRRALVSGDVLGGVGPSLARVLDHRGIGGGRGLR